MNDKTIKTIFFVFKKELERVFLISELQNPVDGSHAKQNLRFGMY